MNLVHIVLNVSNKTIFKRAAFGGLAVCVLWVAVL